MVCLPGVGGVNAPCHVDSLIVRQMGQHLAGITSLACSGILCIRNIKFFVLCPVCEGGRVAMSDITAMLII